MNLKNRIINVLNDILKKYRYLLSIEHDEMTDTIEKLIMEWEEMRIFNFRWICEAVRKAVSYLFGDSSESFKELKLKKRGWK